MLTARKLVMVLGMVIGALCVSGCAGTGAPLALRSSSEAVALPGSH